VQNWHKHRMTATVQGFNFLATVDTLFNEMLYFLLS